MNSMNDVLLMFSGGKDSFLTACKLVEDGYNVKLIMFNSGCIAGEENALLTAQRLISRYRGHIETVGVRSSMATRTRIDKYWKEMSIKELSEHYPNVTGIQAQCFFCQTSMWIEAIAYCLANSIKCIAFGYKSSNKLCTGSEAYLDIMVNICSYYNIAVKTPLWNFEDIKNGIDIRDEELIERRFAPSMMEPKCTIELQAKQKISKEEIIELVRYFNEYVNYKDLINRSERILNCTGVSDTSLK